MSFSEKYYKEVLTKFPDADQKILANIINKIANLTSNGDEIYNLILEILEQIFQEIALQGLGLSLNNLSDQERELLEKELDKILSAINQNGNNISKEDMVKLLIKSLQRKFMEKQLAKRKDDNNLVPEHVRKNLKQVMLRAFIYEFYKFINPNRIAGETAIDNFINNIVYGGLKYAQEHEGKNLSQDAQVMSKVSNIVKDVNKGAFGLGR